MTWATFWAPNLLSATLFAAISGLVGTSVGLIARRWFRQWAEQLFGEQQRTTNAAETAASRAGEALDASHKAVQRAETTGADARSAADNSRQANEVLEWLVPQIAARDAVIEDLKERIDRLLGTRARQIAAGHQPSGELAPTEGTGDEVAVITGKHRLPTSIVPVVTAEGVVQEGS